MNMNQRRWEWKLADWAILVALLFIINPEFQVFLLLVDYLSLELFLFLLLIQWRSTMPVIGLALTATGKWSCITSFAALRGILRVFGALSSGRTLSAFSTWLFVLSRNLWCPLSARSGPQHLQV
jgi:hypothetical protein